MGISSNHCKVVAEHEATNREHFFYLDELMEQAPEFVKQNEHLISKLRYAERFFEMRFFKDEVDLQAAVDVGLVGDPAQLEAEITAILTERQIDGSFFFEEQLHDGAVRRRYPLEYQHKLIMYYQQLGWMKYGMTGDFFKEFVQLEYYFKKADVVKAATYVYDADNIELFQRDFVDCFEEGRSLFYHY